MQTNEDRLTRDLQYDASKLSQTCIFLHRAVLVMQLDINPHKTDCFVDCRIVYVIFPIIIIS